MCRSLFFVDSQKCNGLVNRVQPVHVQQFDPQLDGGTIEIQAKDFIQSFPLPKQFHDVSGIKKNLIHMIHMIHENDALREIQISVKN